MGHHKDKDRDRDKDRDSDRARRKDKDQDKQKRHEGKSSKKKDSTKPKSYEFLKYPPKDQDQFRTILLDYLYSDLFTFPQSSINLFEQIMKHFPGLGAAVKKNLDISPLLQEFSERKGLTLTQSSVGKQTTDYITDINKEKILQLSQEYYKDHPEYQAKSQVTVQLTPKVMPQKPISMNAVMNLDRDNSSLTKIGSEREALEETAQAYKQIYKITEAEEETLKQFRKQQNKIDYCDCGTKEKCQQIKGITYRCSKAHFKKIIRQHTDESLGNCSYLDTCRHMDTCKFVHYELDLRQEVHSIKKELPQNFIPKAKLLEPQWINCDLKKLDFRVLGKFNVIMADPPWDIHMQLPYGTMKDKEMKSLRVDMLQDEGLIFLWVTGRAMELGRECLQIWGYKQVEEIIWVKTNQLQRIIRTGRTGHWLNHSKEHCLVGIKGNPSINTMIDCDVIVSEVRETSRKPDEIYQLIERMHPGGRKIELFGRPHNCSDGWLTLGNQIPGVYILEDELLKNYSTTYPDVETSKEKMEQNKKLLYSQNDEIYNCHIQQTPVNNRSSYKAPSQSPMNQGSTVNNNNNNNSNVNASPFSKNVGQSTNTQPNMKVESAPMDGRGNVPDAGYYSNFNSGFQAQRKYGPPGSGVQKKQY